ncbi:MAG: cardiolipin synthase [Spirochaetia bacterium]|nr:cardiolipin synthase [Spirochaetia bacterium]
MDPGNDAVFSLWPLLAALGGVLVSILASGHAVLYKRDSRAAVAWVGLIWLVPFIGSLLYVLLGINRIRRKVAGLRGHESAHFNPLENFACSSEDLVAILPTGSENLVEMARLGDFLTRLPLMAGNDIVALFDGDEAYPVMLEAIEKATRSINLVIFIFDNDMVGRRFLDSLSQAVARGVDVRVLIDGVGSRYTRLPITGLLRAAGVRTELFMASFWPWHTPYLNLRNHRKVMVVDGMTGFTGGMNIRAGHLLAGNPPFPTRDIHFRVAGPVVQQLQAAFVADWLFTSGELLEGEQWFPSWPSAAGSVVARVIPDGPDQDLDKMSMAFQGALAAARHRVLVMTPYFLPDRALIAALNTCVLRGVEVDIVLPQENNQKLVAWASMAQMWQVLEWGCRVWMSAPPFDHSKVMVVDGVLSLIGSSNWDPRSLRLNFELGVECYDAALAQRLESRIRQSMVTAHQLTMAEVDARPLPLKLRDGLARLAAPYL